MLVACSPYSQTAYEQPAEASKIVLRLGHFDDIKSVAFSPDGKTALSGDSWGTLKWWDLSTWRVIKSLDAHTYPVYSIAFSPEGKTALSGSWDHTTRVWNLESGE
ncbi:MAG: hypothetical protein ABFS56_14950 [Pseudomonadota bacterium]